MKNLKEIHINKIIAVLPVYLDIQGNSTKIIFEDNEDIFIYVRVNRVIKNIAGYYALDLRKVRDEYGSLIESKNMVPIPLTKRDIFIPIKMRKPISKNDGSIGYFNLKYIDDVKIKGEDVYIGTLKCDIKVMNTKNTVIKHINEGKLVKNIYNEKMNDKIYEQNETYQLPATKEDIALLIKEIVDIKRRL